MTAVLSLLFGISIVLATALLVVHLAPGARAAVRHLVLASAFAVVLILPLAILVSPTIVVELPTYPALAIEPVAVPPDATVPPDGESSGTRVRTARPAETPAAPAESSSVAMWLLLAWAAGALIALVPAGAGLLRLRRIRHRARPWPEGRALMNKVAQAANIRPPALLLHHDIGGPVAFGILRPVVVLPASAVRWSHEHVANALVHELEHVRRRDWLVHLTSRLTCALYWFHPLAWIAAQRLRLEAERACDDAVLEQEDAQAYARQLLELARHLAHKPALPGLPMAGRSDLSARIRSLLDNMRPRGRVGRVMIICAALAAVAAVVLLAPLRAAGTLEKRMDRAVEMLAARADADSLAAAGLLVLRQPDRSRSLIAQATRIAPERADLAWLHIQFCAAASCDGEELDARLQDLDGDNGAGWFGALVRATQRGDGQARDSALAAIGQSGRLDLYWNSLVARLSRQIASTGMVSSYEAQIETIGLLAGYAIPALQPLSRACTGERLMQDDVTDVCGGVIRSLLNSDTVIIESMGASLARQVLADDSPERVEATEAHRTRDHRIQFAGDVNAWIRYHPQEHLDLLEQHRREQDVLEAVLIAAGRNPDPPVDP